MKKIIKILIFIVILAAACYGIYSKFTNSQNSPKHLTTSVKKGDIVETVVANGEVFAQNLVDVGAQVSGQIEKLYVKVGDKVKKGDPIADIDAVKQRNSIAKQEAQLNIYEANLKAAEVSLATAKSKYNRELGLFKKDATSKELLENAKNSVASEEAKINQIKAQIKQTKLELNTAQTDLSYTKIIAPIDGTIVSVPVEEGRTVNSNQSTPTIVKIADLTKMEIKMEVAEGDIPKIKEGLKVYYTTLSNLNDKRESLVTSIDPGYTTLSNASSLSSNSSSSSSNNAVYYYVKSLIDNTDNYLRIGMTTENTIIVREKKDVNILPTSAIRRDKNGNFVNILNGNEIQKKYIKIGMSDGINSEIIEGIEQNDQIAISSFDGNSRANSNQRNMRQMRF